MNKPEIRRIIFQLTEFIIQETTRNPLDLSMTSYFWNDSQTWFPKICEIDDIGDYMPFLIWAGKIFHRKDLEKFVEDQIEKWLNYAKLSSGWFITQIDCSKSLPNKSLQPIVSLYELQDTVLGFYNLYQLTGNKKYLAELDSLYSNISKIATKFGGKIPNQLINSLNIPIPWSSTSPAVSGLFAEHAYLYKNVKDQKYEELGDKIISYWLGTSLWKQQNLFHQGYNVYFDSISLYHQTKIMKENSNLVYAMLQRPNKYQKQIIKLLEKLLSFQHRSGAFFAKWDVGKRLIIKDYFDKTQNFTIIDLLLEISYRAKIQNKSETINAAKSCADFWIKQKDNKTQLIPDYIKPNGKSLYQIAKLDQSADLYSSFLRLYSITQEEKYFKEVQIGANALQYFGGSKWWSRIINTKTGKPARDNEVPENDRPTARNLTKYVGGVLRFYLSFYEVLSGKNIYQDKLLWLNSRDR